MPARLPIGMVDDQRTSMKSPLSPVADYIIAGADMSDEIKEMCDLVLDGSTDAAKLQSLITELSGVGKIVIIGAFNSEQAITYASPTLHIAGWGRMSVITASAAHDVFSFSGAGHVTFSNIEIDGNTLGLKGVETTAAGVKVSIRDCYIHDFVTNDVDINTTTYSDVYNLDTNATYSDFAFSGSIIGDLTGDVTGDLTGDVLATDATKVLENGTDGTNSTYLGTVTGSASKLPSGSPVNAEYAIGLLTIGGVVIDTETVTIDSRVYEFDTDSTSTGDVAVDISASAVAAQGTLTITGVVLDTETVTIGTDVYEFDASDIPAVTPGNIAVDISEGSGFSTRSQASVTFVNGDIHNDTVVIQGNTHTLKADATADSATVCNISGAATIANAIGTYGLGGVVSDAETVTIGGDVYEFDDGGGVVGGNIAVLGAFDKATAIQSLYDTIVASGTEPVTPTLNLAGFEIDLEYDVAGVAGNAIGTTDTTPNGGFAAATLTGGANATALELGPIFLAHLDAAGAEANVLQAAGGTADVVVLTWDIGGVAGDAETLTETLTAGGADGGGTFGGTTAGVDCVQADAATQLTVAVTAGDTQGVGAASGGAGIVVLTADVPGTAGDAIVFTELMGNGAVDGGGTLGGTAAGVDCTAANAILALVSAINGDGGPGGAVVTALDGVGDTVYVYADVKGVVGNALTTTEGMANGAWGAGVLAGGVDGTLGAEDDVLTDGTGIFVCTAANTIADDNWVATGIVKGKNRRRELEVGADYYTVPTNDLISCTAGNITITLMSHSWETNEVKTVLDKDGSAGGANITVEAEGAATINGAANVTMAANYDSLDIIKLEDGNFRVV